MNLLSIHCNLFSANTQGNARGHEKAARVFAGGRMMEVAENQRLYRIVEMFWPSRITSNQISFAARSDSFA